MGQVLDLPTGQIIQIPNLKNNTKMGPWGTKPSVCYVHQSSDLNPVENEHVPGAVNLKDLRDSGWRNGSSDLWSGVSLTSSGIIGEKLL